MTTDNNELTEATRQCPDNKVLATRVRITGSDSAIYTLLDGLEIDANLVAGHGKYYFIDAGWVEYMREMAAVGAARKAKEAAKRAAEPKRSRRSMAACDRPCPKCHTWCHGACEASNC